MELTGTDLSVPDVAAVARDRTPVTLAPDVLDRVATSCAYAASVAADRPVYGRSTGVGANRGTAVEDPDAHALALLRSHATSAGEMRSPERVRALLVVRLNQLAADGNGTTPAVVAALADLLDGDVLPPVRDLGSIGTADLGALATVALTLVGETEPVAPTRVRFAAGDALAFLSSNAGALGDAALALTDVDRLARAAVAVAATTFVAVRGNPEAFAEPVEAATPFAGARWVCAEMRSRIGVEQPARIQDPFGLRTLPQVHGALVDRIAEARAVVEAMVNAPTENPVVSASLGVAHHGGFHAAYLAQALDALKIALVESAQLSLSRLTMLNEPRYTGLEPFLGDGTPAASGTMMVEYVVAGALAELRVLANPVSTQAVTLSRGVEDDASFASLAATQALAGADLYRVVLAGELVAAARAQRLRGFDPALDLPTDLADHDLTPDLLAAQGLLDSLT